MPQEFDGEQLGADPVQVFVRDEFTITVILADADLPDVLFVVVYVMVYVTPD